MNAATPEQTIREVLDHPDKFCVTCARPIATDEDWKTYQEGEGTHLCWGPTDLGCDVEQSVVLRRSDVDELVAENARLRATVEAFANPQHWAGGVTDGE